MKNIDNPIACYQYKCGNCLLEMGVYWELGTILIPMKCGVCGSLAYFDNKVYEVPIDEVGHVKSNRV